MEHEEPQISWKSDILKYFEQGILFSVIFLVLVIAWVFLTAFLVLVGYVIGLIIGFVILFFIIAWLNAALTDGIWHMQIRTDWKSLLGHGFFLFIGLIIVHVPAIAVNLAVPGIATVIVLFVVYCFIDGFVARKVAGYFEETYDETGEMV